MVLPHCRKKLRWEQELQGCGAVHHTVACPSPTCCTQTPLRTIWPQMACRYVLTTGRQEGQVMLRDVQASQLCTVEAAWL